MNTYNWYATLIKPTWAPPAELFGPVWTVLYIGIAITFSLTFYTYFKGQLPAYIALIFLVNLAANLLFTPIQFGLQNNTLATLDIFIVLISLGAGIYFIYPYSAFVALANIPYLLWVLFATVLQVTITYLNW